MSHPRFKATDEGLAQAIATEWHLADKKDLLLSEFVAAKADTLATAYRVTEIVHGAQAAQFWGGQIRTAWWRAGRYDEAPCPP